MGPVGQSRRRRFLGSCDRLGEMFERQREFVDSMHAMPNPIKAVAAIRARMHVGNGAAFKRAFDSHYVGLKGEEAFALSFGEPLVFWDQPSGDHGEDFWIPLFVGGESFEMFSVDVKTSRSGSAIIAQRGKVRADIYVLAHYDDETDSARLAGWQWGAVVRESPTKRLSEECHICTAVRPLSDLAINAVWLWENGPPDIPDEWKAVRLVESH